MLSTVVNKRTRNIYIIESSGQDDLNVKKTVFVIEDFDKSM